jgi:hypothetical protein
MRTVLAVLGVSLLTGATPSAVADAPGARIFERMKALAGEWEGTYEWSQGRTGGGPLRVNYFLTGAGSALVESLVQGGVTTMTTVYHLDGADLRMTHYCAARNQPRLKAVKVDEAAGSAEFTLVDVTGVGPKNPGYVEGFLIELLDGDRLHLRFIFGGGPGRSGVENIFVRRIGPAPGAAVSGSKPAAR